MCQTRMKSNQGNGKHGMVTNKAGDLYKSIQTVCITKIRLQLIACSKLRQWYYKILRDCIAHPNVTADSIIISYFHE